MTRILSITICGPPSRGSRSNRKSRAPHAALHDGHREKRWQVRRLGEVRRAPTCDCKPRQIATALMKARGLNLDDAELIVTIR
jgi:hypothetical protein